MQTVNNPARPFTHLDWNSFAGCTEFKLGGHGTFRTDRLHLQPVCRPLSEDIYLVADAECVSAYVAVRGDKVEEWYLNIAFPTQALAMQFLNSFSDDTKVTNLDRLGFTCH